MMPYIVGRDPETNEVIVGDSRSHVFFLRGPSSEEDSVIALVEAANMWAHKHGVPKREPHCECHERDGSYVCEYCYSQGIRGHMEKGIQ